MDEVMTYLLLCLGVSALARVPRYLSQGKVVMLKMNE